MISRSLFSVRTGMIPSLDAWRFKLPATTFCLLWFVVACPSFGREPSSAVLKDLDGHFPFAVPETRQAWQQRAQQVRLQVQIALGVHPRPRLAEPLPAIHGRLQMDGYTVQKVILESLPGHYVTGSLYRPLDHAKQATPRPAVLYAHGHWDQGRFYEASPAAVKNLLASGAERFENAAINHMQAACVQLARMGIVVFQYDMIGYADSQQIDFQRGHRYGINDSNPATTDAGWPLFSTLAEGYGQSIMGLQTINTLQAFEMLARMDDVDAKRIAITGASGGGTQSFIATAVEPRLAGAMPAVMVSTAMQGGCVCENACGLRVGTGNIELAALTAPRALAMTTANDWTIRMPEEGFPELQQLYGLYDKTASVELFPAAHFPHNYNHVARVHLYGWVNRLFGLGIKEPILERDFQLLRREQLTVWDDQHPRPDSGIDYERTLTRNWAEQIDAALGTDHSSTQDPSLRQTRLQLRRDGWNSLASLAELYRSDSVAKVVPESPQLSDPPIRVRLSYSEKLSQAAEGEHLTLVIRDPLASPDESLAPVVPNPRPAAAYTYGYNAPPTIRRLGVLMDALPNQAGDSAAESKSLASRPTVELLVDDDEIVLAALAALRYPDRIAKVRWQTSQPLDYDPLRMVDSIRDTRFIPHALRYQGLPGLLELLEDRIDRIPQP